MIRLLGKRTVGNFSAFDLLVALMRGEVADEISYGFLGTEGGARGGLQRRDLRGAKGRSGDQR